MAYKKTFVCPGAPNESRFLFVQRVSDGKYLQASDGSFGDTISEIGMVASMDQGGTYLGYYEYSEDREIWADGYYRVSMGPSTGTGVYEATVATLARIVGDNLMEGAALASIAARNALAGAAPQLGRIEQAIADLTRRTGVLETKVDNMNVTLARK